ncbi:MAG: DUF6893 family small protein [Bryobacteraceae bacterium]
MNVLKIASIAVAVAVAASVALNWADLKRYLKIECM